MMGMVCMGAVAIVWIADRALRIVGSLGRVVRDR